jgi:hypothetical protein
VEDAAAPAIVDRDEVGLAIPDRNAVAHVDEIDLGRGQSRINAPSSPKISRPAVPPAPTTRLRAGSVGCTQIATSLAASCTLAAVCMRGTTAVAGAGPSAATTVVRQQNKDITSAIVRGM